MLAAYTDLMYTGAIPVTEGHFNSPSLSLLPRSVVFQCHGNEESLSTCLVESNDAARDCIRGAAGVVCQGQVF